MAQPGTYSMQTNRAKKEIRVTIGGTFSSELTQAFIKDCQKEVSSIPTNEYHLKFDAREMDIVTQEQLPHLEGCLQMYKQTGFEKITLEIKPNAVLAMQAKRISRNNNLDNIEVIQVQ